MPKSGAQTRERILAVAVRLFGEQGYEKTSMREVAEELSVSKPALYYHFRSKEELLAGIADDIAAGIEHIVAGRTNERLTTTWKRALLKEFYELVMSRRAEMAVLENNLASFRAMPIGGRSRQAMEAIAEVLMGTERSPAAFVRVTAALQIVRAAPNFGDRVPLDVLEPTILNAAMGALNS